MPAPPRSGDPGGRFSPGHGHQRMRLTEAGVDAAHTHQDIIMGTVMQRQTMNDLLDALHPRDA